MNWESGPIWIGGYGQLPSGRILVAGHQVRADGTDSIGQILFDVQSTRYLDPITVIAENRPLGHPEVAWDGASLLTVFEEISDPDGAWDISAVPQVPGRAPDDLIRLSFEPGDHRWPFIARSEHGYAIVWVDAAEPGGTVGGVSLLVGPLGCE